MRSLHSQPAGAVVTPRGSEAPPRGAPIVAEGIYHAFERNGAVVPALWDLNVEVADGEFVSIVGPSGCGKTTLLAMIGGLITPRVGTIKIDGETVAGPPRHAAYMLARDALLPWRTARHNVEYGLQIRGVGRDERRARSAEWLDRVGLTGFADAHVTELSQGMRQRVAIARTLALEPRVLLMDEPFAALDAQTRMLQQQGFLELWDRTRCTVVFITHDLAEAVLLSDRVVIMSHRPGRIVANVPVTIPRPRAAEMQHGDQAYESLYRRLYDQLKYEVQAQVSEQEGGPDGGADRAGRSL
jgi:NitT/TauT family transport system ATP-binding protein